MPVPPRLAVNELREAVGEYALELRAAGVARDQVAGAIWPALVGIASTRVISKVLQWCLDAYDKSTHLRIPFDPTT